MIAFSDATAVGVATFGAGLGPIHLDDVFCVGFEDNLVDCQYDSNTADCLHFEDAGVRCRRMWELVISVPSSSPYAGGMQIITSSPS